MKVKLFDGVEKQLNLKAETDGDGAGVSLLAVSSSGRDNIPYPYIVSVSEAGIYRPCGVNPDLGLPLDGKGRVKLYGEEVISLGCVLELIKPFADYASVIGPENIDAECWMNVRGRAITVGQFRALAKFYEANK